MKNKTRIVLILFSLISSFYANSFGQKIKYIETITKSNGFYISQVEFIDTTKRSINKTIDVEKHNPFYKILPKSDSISKLFENTNITLNYSNLTLNEIISNEIIKEYRLISDTKISSIGFSKIGTINRKNTDYCLLNFNIVISTERYPVFAITIVEMYNNKGELIFSKQLNKSGFDYVYSNNNKYLCYTVNSGPFGDQEPDKGIDKHKYYIYDIHNNEEIYQGDFINIKGNTGIHKIDDKIVFTGYENQIIFDSKKMLIYKYEYDNGNYTNIGIIKDLKKKK